VRTDNVTWNQSNQFPFSKSWITQADGEAVPAGISQL